MLEYQIKVFCTDKVAHVFEPRQPKDSTPTITLSNLYRETCQIALIPSSI